MPETAVLQDTTFRLRCLGPVSFVAPDGLPRRFRTRKQMALLLVLARRAGRPQGREQLVELLWGGDEPRAARHSLAQSISLINKVFGQDAIRFAGKDQVTLREGLVWVDADAFERAAGEGRYEEARALWRGNLMEGLWVQRAPAFEAWIDTERQRLKRLHRTVLHAAVEAERTAGNWSAMRATAESLLESDPLDEAAMLGYLEALTLGGDRTLALRRFAEFELRLKDELDAEPGAALRAWIKRQRRGDGLPAPAAPVSFPRVAETQTLPTARPVYGREEEFKFLWDAWAAAQQSQGAFIILEGPAGIGKSALAGKLANQAHVMGGAVCFVRCWRTEKSVPFAPITALIRQLMRLPGFVALSEVWIGELSRLVPELRERYPNAPAPMAIDDSARHRICDGTLQASVCVADEQPLMVIVDDIQDADEATLALLHYLGRQAGSRPALLLCVSRDHAFATELERTFFETARSLRIARFLALKALPLEQTTRIARQVLAQRGLEAPDEVIALIHDRARGNPLQVIETAMAIPVKIAGDDQWTEFVRRRFDRDTDSFDKTSSDRMGFLSRPARRLAAVMAVAARPMTEYELAAVCGLSPAHLLDAMIELEQENFVRRTGIAVGFVHDRYQASIQQTIDASLLKELHLELAHFLVRSAAENPSARYEVAKHYECAGAFDHAKAQALQAARYASSIGAAKEQSMALALAFRVAPAEMDIAFELTRCLLAIRDCAGVAAMCERIRGSGVQLTASRNLELQYFQVAQEHFAGVDSLESTAGRLEAILTSSDEAFPDRLHAYLLLVRVLDRSGYQLRARRAARELRRQARELGTPTGTAFRFLSAGWVVGKHYSSKRALPLLERALKEAQSAHAPALEQICREGIAVLLSFAGRYEESLLEHGLTRRLAQRLLDPLGEAMALNNLGVAELNLCRWSEAEAHFEEAICLASHHPNWPYLAFPHHNLGIVLMNRGMYEQADVRMRYAYECAARLGLWTIQMMSAGGLGVSAARQRRFQDLRKWANRIMKDLDGKTGQMPDGSLMEATLAWNRAVNEGDPDGAFQQVQRVARQLETKDVDHFLSLQLETLLLREHLAGRRHEEGRRQLVERAEQEGSALARKYTWILSLNQ